MGLEAIPGSLGKVGAAGPGATSSVPMLALRPGRAIDHFSKYQCGLGLSGIGENDPMISHLAMERYPVDDGI